MARSTIDSRTDIDSRTGDDHDAHHQGIYAHGLVKTYGEKRALDHFDLDVAPGTICGLLGPNGSGCKLRNGR